MWAKLNFSVQNLGRSQRFEILTPPATSIQHPNSINLNVGIQKSFETFFERRFTLNTHRDCWKESDWHCSKGIRLALFKSLRERGKIKIQNSVGKEAKKVWQHLGCVKELSHFALRIDVKFHFVITLELAYSQLQERPTMFLCSGVHLMISS